MTNQPRADMADGETTWHWKAGSRRRNYSEDWMDIWIVYRWDNRYLVQVDIARCDDKETALGIIADHNAAANVAEVERQLDEARAVLEKGANVTLTDIVVATEFPTLTADDALTFMRTGIRLALTALAKPASETEVKS